MSTQESGDGVQAAPELAPALQRLAGALPEHGYEVVPTSDSTTPCVRIERAGMHDFMRALLEQCGFETNTFVTAIDRTPREPRFELSYQFLSMEHNDRLRVIIDLAEEDASIPTINDLWPGTAFSERECYDMFGVIFEGYEKLERLLMPEGFDHYPLRKDFPHAGIEPDRLYREWERSR